MERIPRCIPPLMLGLLLALPPASAAPPVAPGSAVETQLGPLMRPELRSEVLVVGTAHLAGIDWIQPAHLDGVLDLLARFAPTRIAVERLPPDEVALLLERAAHDRGAQQVLDQFAGPIVTHDRAMQQALGVDRAMARSKAEALLADAGGLAEPARVELVGLLLAAYEFDSAALQWSYLSPEARARAQVVPEPTRQALDQRLAASDEIAALAMPLARRLGLQRLDPVDSQYEAVRTLALPEAALEEASRQAWGEEWRATPAARRMQHLFDQAAESHDMLALLRQLNSEAVQRDDAMQWHGWLVQDRADGVHRFRYAMWELRNQRMAANVLDVAASPRPERVMLLVGASHKAFVDRALAPHLGISLVQLADLEARGGAR